MRLLEEIFSSGETLRDPSIHIVLRGYQYSLGWENASEMEQLIC